jgi:hypothetical protein
MRLERSTSEEPAAPQNVLGDVSWTPKVNSRQQVEHDDNWSEAEDHGNNLLGDKKFPAHRVLSIGCLITHGVPHGFVGGTSNKPKL